MQNSKAQRETLKTWFLTWRAKSIFIFPAHLAETIRLYVPYFLGPIFGKTTTFDDDTILHIRIKSRESLPLHRRPGAYPRKKRPGVTQPLHLNPCKLQRAALCSAYL
ncbi:hypothetical protein J6590_037560 [Homalodisca vitripennis]|nr:hypothetical protein J6590_037560 [Homalodisca vitripennis]